MEIEAARRRVLLRAMEAYSEDRWCATWLDGLEHEIARCAERDDEDAQAILQVARELGGIWHWRDAPVARDAGVVFSSLADALPELA